MLRIKFSVKVVFFLFSELKDLYPCPIEIFKGLTEKGQFQYLTGLKGLQEGTYLYTTITLQHEHT